MLRRTSLPKTRRLKKSKKSKRTSIQRHRQYIRKHSRITTKKKKERNQRKYSRDLPRSLSLLSPMDIGVMVQDRVRRIEGPVTARIMVPRDTLSNDLGRNGPVIVLLSDAHHGNQRCDSCQEDEGCYSLYQPSTFMTMINELARDESISTDLFLEVWLDEWSRQNISTVRLGPGSNQNSSLGEMISWLSHCYTRERLQTCPLPNLRTHLSDPRGHTQGMTNILDQIQRYVKDIPSLIRMKENIQEEYPHTTPNDIFDLLDRMFHSQVDGMEVFTHPFFQSSRFYHEFEQLPIPVIKHLVRTTAFIKDEYKDTITCSGAFESHINDFIKILKDPYSIPDYNFYIFSYIASVLHKESYGLKFNFITVDLYTVSRMLKSFHGGLPSQLSIVYLGAKHTENIMHMLSGYYDLLQSYGNTNFITEFEEEIKQTGSNDSLLTTRKCIDANE